ncbi:MAG: DEAD/DEAH box helicase [Desulfobacterales bacterium]|nr:DEAD/DEAH box helicase [Desulfobacterales bacterium]
MKKITDINEYIQSLITSDRLGDQVAYHITLPGNPPVCSETEKPLPEEIKKIINSYGIHNLYMHQVQALDLIRSGRHVVVATPTASGKTLVYNLPVLENIYKNSGSKALYIFPLKALAQDQFRTFNEMASYSKTINPESAIYDGDTTHYRRRRIREKPPNVLLTNPEMLHLSLLAHHRIWAAFLSGLDIVVIDEVHTYRGVMGSHMAQVFRRLQRICAYYRAFPTFVFSSATVSNPAQLAEQLTDLKVENITKSGAPRGRKHVVFMDPIQGPVQTAILLLKAALHRGLRTIVYTQSRKMTELIALWAGSKAGTFADRISAYRAGFLPEERREIEAKLSNGDLLAVVSTSALELGIDIGDLDLCILVGYPGTIVATWQRGGRVGRSGQDSSLIIIPGEDALDQYFMRNPEELISRDPEQAVINPYNPEILAKHLACAAAELSLKADEPMMSHEPVKAAVYELEDKGVLLRSADGKELHSGRKLPHRDVDLRGAGYPQFNIICRETGRIKGDVDGFRAFKETHPGAVYLHKGDTYLVDHLELDTRTVIVSRARTDYYTKVREHKTTEILDTFQEKTAWGARFYMGWLKVTDQVTGYERVRIHGRQKINIIPLDLPPLIFETEGLWFEIPLEIQRETETNQLHFMGGIHAIEHAGIGIFPLLVMADRNDLGGISTNYHSQTGCASVFIYDAIPGGAGLSRQAFIRAKELLEYTLKIISECPCEFGCPSCVHSPKCGSGNRPINKAAAIFLLNRIKEWKIGNAENRINSSGQQMPGGNNYAREFSNYKIQNTEFKIKEPVNNHPVSDIQLQSATGSCSDLRARIKSDQNPAGLDNRQPVTGSYSNLRNFQNPVSLGIQQPLTDNLQSATCNYGVLDIETQRSSQEAGGWHRADRMGISCVVVYDSKKDTFHEFLENQVSSLINMLKNLDLIIGFNIKRFDYLVLRGYTHFNFRKLPTLDILEEVHKRLGYRLALDHLARVTLGSKKSASGLQALEWWKQGRIREIIEYCKKDVAITRDLFLYGKKNGYLLFNNKAGNTVRVPVRW